MTERDLLELLAPIVRALRTAERECAEAEGLTMWQYAILSVASRREGLSQVDLSRLLAYSKNRIVGDLDVLTERGLAERRPGPDRRSYSVHVTASGRAAATRIGRRIRAREEQILPGGLPGRLREVLEDGHEH